MYDHVDEIICLDAGSTDKTLDVIRCYDKARYYVIPQPSQARGGTGWNEGDRRNIIQNAAYGDWILCLGCDELLDDVVWENLDEWLEDDGVLGYGFYRINYMYNLKWHIPIHQPLNGGEVRIYRNFHNVKWETDNAHNFLRYYNEDHDADRNVYHEGVRMYDHPNVINTKYLIHHLHRIGVRGNPPVHDRRDEVPRIITEEFVKAGTHHRTEDNKYFRPIKYPSILKEKGII
jgi:glycosyltransferase involved in cell wall biosynthesis